MNRFRDWVNQNVYVAAMLDIYRRRGLTMDGRYLRSATWYAEQEAQRVQKARLVGPLNTEEIDASRKSVFLMSQLLGGGPKIYRPTVDETEALEHVELRLPVSEYEQPFETFAVEYPEAYASRRRLPYADTATEQSPVLAVAHHNRDWLLVGIFTEDNAADTIGIDLRNGDRSMEQALHANIGAATHLPHLRSLLRVVLNACLLLTNYGCERVGYDDPKGTKKLKERANRNDAQAEWHRNLLAATPPRRRSWRRC